MKAIWSGSISFGLVNIPVKLYSAISPQSIKFRLLHKTHHKPIKYRRTCQGCESDVAREDIVKGIEVRKDEYIVMDQEELATLKPEKTQTIDIEEFVNTNEIDSIYQDKHYYVGPDGPNKSFFLLAQTLEKSGKAAIGRFVMREKEYVCSIEPYRQGLLLTTLNYAYEVREMEIAQEAPALKEKELKLAQDLVKKLTSDFDIREYEDTFARDLREFIEKKQRGEEIEVITHKPTATSQDKLLDALKASLEA